jgi:hydrogenase/urease accessory protein HupE
VSTGMGPAYDSVSHFLLSPEYLAPVLGLALWSGLRGPDHGRWALFAATGAWLFGGLLGVALLPPGTESPLLTAATCLTLGVLVAADLRTSLALTIVFSALIGLLDGAMNAAAEGTGSNIPGLLGDCATVFVIMALAASLIVPLRLLWLRIAVRVAGSWLAALGLLLAGWAIRANV